MFAPALFRRKHFFVLLEDECPHERRHVQHLRLDRVSPYTNFVSPDLRWDGSEMELQISHGICAEIPSSGNIR